MKILHVITTLDIGGAEKQLLLVSKKQANRGNQVTVAYLKEWPTLAGQFRSSGIEIFEKASNKNILKQIFALRRFIKVGNFDIVHLHLPRAEVIGFLSVFPGPYIVSRHNAESFIPGGNRSVSRFLSRIIASRAKSVIAITQSVKNFLVREREIRTLENVEVVPYGIEQMKSKRHNSRSLNQKKNGLVFGTMARLVPQKNLDVIIHSFAKFNQTNNQSSLLLAGVGILEDQLKNHARLSGVENSIHFLGKVNAEDFLNSLDCFVLSSKYEGFGLVILEAIQAGLPILCSRTEAALEILGSNYEGLFSIGDIDELFSLMFLCGEEKFRKHLIEINQEVLNKYRLDGTLNALDVIYSKCVLSN